MEQARTAGRTIHFDLTNIKDLPGALNGTGEFANTITAAELRYLKANWDQFKNNVKFYENGVERGAPW